MKWWQGLLTAIGGMFTREGGIADKAMGLIAERTEDIDKRNSAIVELTRMQMEAERNPVWLSALSHWPTLTLGPRIALSVLIWASALHKLGRLVLWGFVVYVGAEAIAAGQIDMEQFAALAAGPAIYTLLKGRGNK